MFSIFHTCHLKCILIDSFFGIILDTIVLCVRKVPSVLWTWSLHMVGVTCAPRNSANIAIILLLVELNHVLINFSSLPVNVLVLLLQLKAILISLVVKLIHCLLVIPVFVCLKLRSSTSIVYILPIVESTWVCLALPVKTIYIWERACFMLLLHVIGVVLQGSFLLSFWLILWLRTLFGLQVPILRAIIIVIQYLNAIIW